MLNNLTVNNYKCLVECSLELKPLNLFAGPNSSGKSTALQALLIASDNVTEQKGKHGLKNRRTEASNFNDVGRKKSKSSFCSEPNRSIAYRWCAYRFV